MKTIAYLIRRLFGITTFDYKLNSSSYAKVTNTRIEILEGRIRALESQVARLMDTKL